MAVAVQTLVENCLVGLGIYQPGDSISSADSDFCRREFNKILEDANTEKAMSWSVVFSTFTFTPALQPHTIGPSGATWTLAVRPVSLDAARLSMGSGVTRKITVRDAAWWNDQAFKTLTSSTPTDVYYAADVPLGKAYFWPVPTAATSVTLMTRSTVTAVLLTDSLDLPPGYQSAFELLIQEAISEPFGRELSAAKKLRLGEARARIRNNNLSIPSLITGQLGLPVSSGAWDYRTLSYRE